ncbi:serine hydrolase family protein, partial [Campylobacter coli]|nr:serine hydrolase family protein [Campylobacter coli]
WVSENLAKKLNAKFIQTPNGGHFMESEGFKDLPLVIEELERIK